jgi:hypothetical protein
MHVSVGVHIAKTVLTERKGNGCGKQVARCSFKLTRVGMRLHVSG